MKTFSAKTHETKRKWYLIDAKGRVAGKVAVKAANLLRGKEKSTFTAHIDTGDHVVITNAAEVVFTGQKEVQKSYMSFSGYMGGHKSEAVKDRRKRRPTLLVEHAVKGMVPHNRLGRQMLRKLYVYAGSEHPHEAQQPVLVNL